MISYQVYQAYQVYQGIRVLISPSYSQRFSRIHVSIHSIRVFLVREYIYSFNYIDSISAQHLRASSKDMKKRQRANSEERKAYLDACEYLNIDPELPSGELFKLARAKYKRLVLTHHPDKNGQAEKSNP